MADLHNTTCCVCTFSLLYSMTRFIIPIVACVLVTALNIDHQGFFEDVKNFFDPPRPPPPPPPCFSEASTMTRSECQQQRLTALQGKIYPLFLGIFKALKQLQARALGQIAMGNQVSVNVTSVKATMNGSSDPNTGLIGQTAILTKAAGEIDDTTEKASKAMWSQAAKLQKAITNDTNSLKKSQTAGLAQLQSVIDNANKLQAKLSGVYQGVASRRGNSALQTMASALTANQSVVAGAVTAGNGLLANTTTTVAGQTSEVQGRLKVLKKTTTQAPTKLLGSVNSHAEALVSMIGGSQENIATAASGSARSVGAQAQAASLAFEAASEAEFAKAANEWSKSSDNREKAVSSSFVDTEAQLAEAEDFWSSSLNSSETNVSTTTKQMRSSVAAKLTSLTSTSADYKSQAGNLSAALASVGGSVKDAAGSASSQATTTASAMKVKMSQLANTAMADVHEQLGALNTSATEIQTQARSSILESQSQISSEISSLYAEASKDSGRLTEQSATASAALDSGTAAVKAKLKADSEAAAAYGEQTASDLMGQLMDLGTSVGDSSQATAGNSSQQAADKTANATNSMNQVGSDTEAAGQRAATKGTAASAELTSSVSSVMNQLGAAGMSAQDMSSRIEALLSSQKGAVSSVDAAGGSTAKDLAAAADEVASGSANTAATLASTMSSFSSEASRGANTTAMSAQAALLGIVSSAKRSLADTDTTAAVKVRNLQAKQSQLSTKLTSLSGQTASLESALDFLGNQSTNQTTAISNSFLQAWNKLGVQSNITSSNLLVDATASQAEVQSSIVDKIKKATAGLRGDAMRTAQAQQANLSSSLVASTDLTSVISSLDQKVNGSQGSYDGIHAELESILKNLTDTMSEQKSDYMAKYTEMLEKLSSLKSSTNSSLHAIVPIIQNAVTDIPKQIENGATRIIGAASSAADTIAAKIAALEAAEGAATSDAQKQAAREALNVLYHMQTVNQVASEANTAMLKEIADGNSVDSTQLQGIQDTLVGVQGAVTGLSSTSKAQATSLQSSTQDVAQAVSGLFDQLGSSVGQTAASLARNGDAVSSEADFNAQLSRSRNSQSFSSTESAITSYASGGAEDSASLEGARQEVSSKVGVLHDQDLEMQKSVNISVAEVVEKQKQAAAALSKAKKKSDSDVMTQMMTIKIAMEGFVKLWKELAGTMTDKFNGFRGQNKQDLTLVDMALKRSLIQQETKLSKTLVDAVNVSYVIDAANEANQEFESYMDDQLRLLKVDQKNATNAVKQQLVDIRTQISDYEIQAKRADEQLRETVKDSLDHLDSDLVQKLVIAHGIPTAN